MSVTQDKFLPGVAPRFVTASTASEAIFGRNTEANRKKLLAQVKAGERNGKKVGGVTLIEVPQLGPAVSE